MVKDFDISLSKLKSSVAQVSPAYSGQELSDPAVQLLFTEGSRLRTDYWRLVRDGEMPLSSFDHRQKYGLPTPIDAIVDLKNILQDKSVTDVHRNKATGDLIFRFTNEIEFQVLNFTGYEVWEIHFPDGTGEYSNYVL